MLLSPFVRNDGPSDVNRQRKDKLISNHPILIPTTSESVARQATLKRLVGICKNSFAQHCYVFPAPPGWLVINMLGVMLDDASS